MVGATVGGGAVVGVGPTVGAGATATGGALGVAIAGVAATGLDAVAGAAPTTARVAVSSGVATVCAVAVDVLVGVAPLVEATCREGELATATVLVRDVPAATVGFCCCLLFVKAKMAAPAKMRTATATAIREIVRVLRGIWPVTLPPIRSTACRRRWGSYSCCPGAGTRGQHRSRCWKRARHQRVAPSPTPPWRG